MSRHVQHLLVAYIHRQLPPYKRNRVTLHLQKCEECQAALDVERRLSGELATTMALIGRPKRGQIARLWPRVWREFSGSLGNGNRPQKWLPSLPSYSLLFLAAVLCVFTISGLFGGQAIAAALPLSPALVQITETPGAGKRPATITDVPATQPATQPADGTAHTHLLPSASPAPLASAPVFGLAGQ